MKRYAKKSEPHHEFFSKWCGSLQLDFKKVTHDFAINITLESGQPIELEFLRRDPPVGTEFRILLPHVHLRRIWLEAAEKVGLLLAVATVFPEFFPAGMLWIEITITLAAIHDFIMFRLEAHLLAHFPVKRLFERFAHIHSALRKLPRSRDGPAFANQQVPFLVYH